MAEDLIQLIREKYARLTDAQKQVADAVMDDPARCALLTSTKLAQQVQVSEATVVRFAVELGYSGYAELKRVVRDNMLANRTLVRLQQAEDQPEGDRHRCLMSMDADLENLRATMAQLDPADVDRAAEALCQARRVFTLGKKRTEALAIYLDFFLKLSLDSAAILQDETMLEAVTDIGKGDCLVALSFRRYSKDTVRILRHAKRRGAFCIAISDSRSSPLTEFADVFFVAETVSPTFQDSYTAAMALINGLWAEISHRNQEKSWEKLKVLEELFKETNLFY